MSRFVFRRMSLSPLLAVLLSLTALAPATNAAAPDLRTAILRVMTASAAAWSAGDLDRFMDTYEDSPDTVYVGKAGTVNGRAAIQTMYAAHFDKAAPGSLGKLSFETIDVRPLGKDHALMIGRYHLVSPEAGKPDANGIFTLVFHQRRGQWRIVCDHTS